jgi:PAS domain-containing protein
MPNRRNKNDIQASTDREAAAEIVRLSQRVEQLEANFAPASGPAAGMDYEPRLRESLETCPIGVAILADDDGSRLFVNPALEAML